MRNEWHAAIQMKCYAANALVLAGLHGIVDTNCIKLITDNEILQLQKKLFRHRR
jgi:hypothetical protein